MDLFILYLIKSLRVSGPGNFLWKIFSFNLMLFLENLFPISFNFAILSISWKVRESSSFLWKLCRTLVYDSDYLLTSSLFTVSKYIGELFLIINEFIYGGKVNSFDSIFYFCSRFIFSFLFLSIIWFLNYYCSNCFFIFLDSSIICDSFSESIFWIWS